MNKRASWAVVVALLLHFMLIAFTLWPVTSYGWFAYTPLSDSRGAESLVETLRWARIAHAVSLAAPIAGVVALGFQSKARDLSGRLKTAILVGAVVVDIFGLGGIWLGSAAGLAEGGLVNLTVLAPTAVAVAYLMVLVSERVRGPRLATGLLAAAALAVGVIICVHLAGILLSLVVSPEMPRRYGDYASY